MNEKEVDTLWKRGYNAYNYYIENEFLKKIVDSLIPGFNGMSFKDIHDYLIAGSMGSDPYMCLADFGDYCRIHEFADRAYNDRMLWNKMSLVNIAKAGIFAADRSVKDYADNIWHIKPVNMPHGK